MAAAVPGVGEIPQVPAFLPMANAVPTSEPMPIDGTWLISTIRKTIRIEQGRAYAVDGWTHLFVLDIQPGMVVIKDIRPTAPGEYGGQDLPLMGAFTARLGADRSLTVSVQGALGPVRYQLIPMQLDDPAWFNAGMAQAGFQPPPSAPVAGGQPSYALPPRPGSAPGYAPQPNAPPPAYPPQQPPPPAVQPVTGPPSAPPTPGYGEGVPPATGAGTNTLMSQHAAYTRLAARQTDAGSSAGSAFDFAVDLDTGVGTSGYCSNKGGPNQERCEEVDAIDHGATKKGCFGANLYQSDGNCWRCPEGYKRASLMRKMSDPEACQERGLGFSHDYTRATLERDAWGCPDGQFKYKGNCMTCPAGTKRQHVLGIDSGKCSVPREHQCNDGLVLVKTEPDGFWDRMGNWVGSKKRKICAPPLDLFQWANEAAVRSPAAPVLAALGSVAIRLMLDDRETKDKVAQLKEDLKDGDAGAALETLKTFDEWPALVQAAQIAGGGNVSISVTGDISAGIGYAYEHGLVVNLAHPNRAREFKATSLAKGATLAIDGGFTLGAWGSGFDGYSQGYVASVEGVGVGVWSSYYDASAGPPRVLGFTVGAGIGAGFEIGEYNEVHTEYK
jgi:hypothetical protein